MRVWGVVWFYKRKLGINDYKRQGGMPSRKKQTVIAIPNRPFLTLKILGPKGIRFFKKWFLGLNKRIIILQRSFGKLSQWQLIFKITPS